MPQVLISTLRVVSSLPLSAKKSRCCTSSDCEALLSGASVLTRAAMIICDNQNPAQARFGTAEDLLITFAYFAESILMQACNACLACKAFV